MREGFRCGLLRPEQCGEDNARWIGVHSRNVIYNFRQCWGGGLVGMEREAGVINRGEHRGGVRGAERDEHGNSSGGGKESLGK